MAVWSEVDFRDVCYTTRYDAEFYRPEYLRYAASVAKGDILSDCVKISHPAEIKRVYEESGIRILLAQNVRANRLDFTVAAYMPFCVEKFLRRNLLAFDDVIMTRSGANFGDTAVYKGSLEPVYACADVLIMKPKGVAGGYISTYFNTDIGRALLTRGAYGAAQPHIAPNYLNEMFLPRIGIENERQIDSVVEAALLKNEESKAIYQEAEALLLHELGLDALDLSDEITYERNFDEVAKAGRLDAQHFQPKYYRVLDAIKTTKPQQIVNLDSLLEEITNGQTPLHHDLSIGDVRFLTAEHIYDFRINYDSDKRIETEHHEKQLKKTQVKKNDVLITIKGRIGNVTVVEDVPFPTNINQDVGLLRLKENIHPYYVAGFLNSQAGKALTEQVCTGQINPFLGLGNLKTVQIPIFKTERMNELGEMIKAKVNEATETQQSAKQLLEDAKRRVEDMILGA